jgi:hypothetical protein
MTSSDSLIHESAQIDSTAKIGLRVILDGPGIIVSAGATIGSGALISSHVSVGLGSVVKAGSVVTSNVPPNAIVEGNPAKVIGYTNSELLSKPAPKTILDRSLFLGKQAPTSLFLGVKNSTLHLLRSYQDSRGNLSVGEVPSELPFVPQRFFIVYGVPSAELRGEHAHRLCDQFLICIHGSVRVLLDDGVNRCEVILTSPSLGLYMPSMIWGTQYEYSSDASLLVFASLPYDSADYIRSYHDFLKAAQNHSYTTHTSNL